MQKKGFTLIEILIVVAIIGILTTIAIAAGSSAKKLARDNQRKSDISLLQVKLETYRDIYGKYPLELDYASKSLTNPGDDGTGAPIILSANMPKDPGGRSLNIPYMYVALRFSAGDSTTCGVSYYLYATLENGNNVKHAILPSTLGSCGNSLPNPTTPNIYDVTSPSTLQN